MFLCLSVWGLHLSIKHQHLNFVSGLFSRAPGLRHGSLRMFSRLLIIQNNWRQVYTTEIDFEKVSGLHSLLTLNTKDISSFDMGSVIIQLRTVPQLCREKESNCTFPFPWCLIAPLNKVRKMSALSGFCFSLHLYYQGCTKRFENEEYFLIMKKSMCVIKNFKISEICQEVNRNPLQFSNP